jgi:Peptidase A4 family
MRSLIPLLALAAAAAMAPGVTMAQAIPGQASASSNRSLAHDHPLRATSLTTVNWAGYAVASSPGAVTGVKGVWRVPAVNPLSCPGGRASFWVGIDGLGPVLLSEPRGRKPRVPVETGFPTIERIGIDVTCSGPSPGYSAWFELYPYQPIAVIQSVQVAPGDLIEAEVRFLPESGLFNLALVNWTRNQSFITSGEAEQAQRSSATWIVEAPDSPALSPLADFGFVEFREAVVTANGATLPIGSNGGISAFTMATRNNPAELKAAPSLLYGQGSRFDVYWLSAGP